jgi:hypothetical protein
VATDIVAAQDTEICANEGLVGKEPPLVS